MIKSVTISPYNSNSHMGEKARSLVADISSCDGIVNTNSSIYKKEIAVQNVQENVLDDIDTCIQYVKYMNFVKSSYTNIGIFEPSLQGNTQEKNFLRLLDYIIVRSHKQRSLLPKCLQPKTFVARPNVAQVAKQSPIKKISKDTAFCVSALGKHTNLEKVLKAYLSSFTSKDNVILNILSNSPEELSKFVTDIRNSLSIFGKIDLYPTVAIYGNADVYQKSNCFIDVSMDYSISLHTMMSVSYANPLVTCNHDGILEWLDQSGCYIVDSRSGTRESNLIGNIPDEIHLSETMKRVVRDRKELNRKQSFMLDSGFKSFYYNKEKSVGDIVCSLL